VGIVNSELELKNWVLGIPNELQPFCHIYCLNFMAPSAAKMKIRTIELDGTWSRSQAARHILYELSLDSINIPLQKDEPVETEKTGDAKKT